MWHSPTTQRNWQVVKCVEYLGDSEILPPRPCSSLLTESVSVESLQRAFALKGKSNDLSIPCLKIRILGLAVFFLSIIFPLADYERVNLGAPDRQAAFINIRRTCIVKPQ